MAKWKKLKSWRQSLTAISGSYTCCHVSLGMSFQLLSTLVSLTVELFLSPLVAKGIQWNNVYGIGTWNKPASWDVSECDFIFVFY